MHTYTHVHIHINAHIYTHARSYTHTHTHTHTRARARAPTHTYTHPSSSAHTYTHKRVRIHTRTNVRARAHTHIDTHTHTYAHIKMFCKKGSEVTSPDRNGKFSSPVFFLWPVCRWFWMLWFEWLFQDWLGFFIVEFPVRSTPLQRVVDFSFRRGTVFTSWCVTAIVTWAYSARASGMAQRLKSSFAYPGQVHRPHTRRSCVW